ncbi:MAG TPA: GNAT family N-acetyltransferase [Acidobacteriota bacterium]|nr:GNAT family N-acetyltransferase [Acidobacteriota bacterium]
MTFQIRPMAVVDWEEVRSIYLEGLAGGQATFETETPSWDQWDSSHLTVCRLVARAREQIVGWAALSPVSRRACYAGVAEVSVYVRASFRGQGLGEALLRALIDCSEQAGIWTLQGSTFPENSASLRLQERCGFRVVGRRERIARHHGVWRDTILTERRSSIAGRD